MSDNLRYRIAAAIYDASDEYARKLMVRPDCPGASELEGDSKPVCYTLADAVIAELSLRREDLGGFRVPGYGHRGYRYVTDWIAEQTILPTAPGADFDGGIELTSTELDEFLRLAREP